MGNLLAVKGVIGNLPSTTPSERAVRDALMRLVQDMGRELADLQGRVRNLEQKR